MKKMTALTGNGAPAYKHSMSHLLEFFSKGGSIRSGKTYYTDKAENVLELFKAAWRSGNEEASMKLLFWCRDARGGAGNRQVFRDCIKWLADTDSDWVNANVHLIPVHGRFDDLTALYGTECEKAALDLWAAALLADDSGVTPLAAKWADRQDNKLRIHMDMTPKSFRKMVVAKTGWVVEKSMCSGNWENIEFSKIPSVAGARYRNAFKKHQEARYNQWCLDLATNKKVNASVLFPHDVIRTIKSTSDQDKAFETLIDVTFENLPNYIEDPTKKIMPICDFSGSMDIAVSGSVTAIDVSLALGLYCSDRLGKDNPFYRKLIPFSTSAKLVSWQKMSVVKAAREIPDGYCGGTNIEKALNTLLDSAVMWNVKPDQMITTLIVFSDMQWDPSVTGIRSMSVIEQCMKKWEDAGYERPVIVYWNLHAYDNQPATKNDKNVALVSGFSPSILKAVLADGDINPIKVMNDAISKYEIVTP